MMLSDSSSSGTARMNRQGIPGYINKSILIYNLIILDLLVNSVSDFGDFNTGNTLAYVFIGVQLIVQVAILTLLISLFCNTALVKIGLVGYAVNEFRFLLVITIPLQALIFICYISCKIGLLLSNGGNGTIIHDDLWFYPAFVFFSCSQKVASMIYYVALHRTIQLFGEPRLYDNLIVKQYIEAAIEKASKHVYSDQFISGPSASISLPTLQKDLENI
jgi:Transmembrane protein 138